MANQERQKDQEMAQRLKAQGVTRTTSRCCICYQLVPTGARKNADGTETLPDTSTHVTAHCKGPPRKGARQFGARRVA